MITGMTTSSPLAARELNYYPNADLLNGLESFILEHEFAFKKQQQKLLRAVGQRA